MGGHRPLLGGARHRSGGDTVKAVSNKRRRENRLRSRLLKARRGPGPTRCEAYLPGCIYTVDDGHEIQTAGRGGSRIDLVNVADLCRHCHDVITDNTGWADRHGWTLHSWATPADIARAHGLRATFHCGLGCNVDHWLEAA
jgi:hypothetical protein